MADSKAIAIQRGVFLDKNLKKQGVNLVEAAKKLSILMDKEHTRSGINNKTKGLRGIHVDEIPFLSKIIKLPPSILAWYFDKYEAFQNHYDPFEDFISRKHEIDNVFVFQIKDRSLEPEIREGDKLLINKGTPELKEKTLVLISGEDSAVWVRYIKPEITGGYIVFCNDKENQPDQKLEDLSTVNIIGTVINITRWL